CLDAEPGGEVLISPVAGSIQVRELLPPLCFTEDLADGISVQLAGRVHLNRSLCQPHLDERGISRPAGAGRAPEAGRELVDGALGDADEGSDQVPPRHAPDGQAIAEAPMELPSSPLSIAGAARVHRAVLRDKGIPDHDVLAARPAHPGGEPRVEDFVVRARNQRPDVSVGTRYSHQYPAGGVAAAGKAPATGDPEPAGHGLGLASCRVETAGSEDIRRAGEEFLLGLLREMADPPVMHRPEGVAPGGGAARTAQLPCHVKGRVIFDAEAAVSRRVADADKTGGDQVLHRLRRNLPQLFGLGRTLP